MSFTVQSIPMTILFFKHELARASECGCSQTTNQTVLMIWQRGMRIPLARPVTFSGLPENMRKEYPLSNTLLTIIDRGALR
jgi:hypothetical protein